MPEGKLQQFAHVTQYFWNSVAYILLLEPIVCQSRLLLLAGYINLLIMWCEQPCDSPVGLTTLLLRCLCSYYRNGFELLQLRLKPSQT